jgi:Zn-dependent protease with chaperone function
VPIENTLRIAFIFIALVLFPLIFSGLGMLAQEGSVSYYSAIFKRLAEYWTQNKLADFLYLVSNFFFHLNGLIIPLGILFYLLFGYKWFQHSHKYQEVFPREVESKALQDLKDIFFECLKVTNLKLSVKIFLLNESAEDLAGFSGCGVIGKGKNIAVLLSQKLVDLFREGRLSTEEIKAIFLHEISHIVHKDHFLPLWTKQFTQSRLFTFTYLSLILAILCALSASIARDGMIVVRYVKWKFLGISFATFSTGLLLLRSSIWQFIAQAMREREYLADARAGYIYMTPDIITKAIEKVTFLFPVQGAFSSVFSFAGTGRTPSLNSEVTEISSKILHVFLKVKKVLFRFLTGKVNWHPSSLRRIKALKQNENLFKGEEGSFISHRSVIITVVVINAIWFLLFLLLGVFIEGDKGMEFLTNNALLSSLLIAVSLSILNFLPMVFLDSKTFIEGLVGPVGSVFGAAHLPYLLITSKLWRRIHINNFFIALVPSLLLNIPPFVFNPIYFLKLLFGNFLLCTLVPLSLGFFTYLVKAMHC